MSTRYVGCKRRTIDWIFEHLGDLDYDTCLDGFGGTAAVSFEFKKRGKLVHYNDIMKWNYLAGQGLIENTCEQLSKEEIDFVVSEHSDIRYPNFIQNTFGRMFFTAKENRWLDIAITNISQLQSEYKRALAFYSISQAALIKRPFNLFHRNNLYIRQAKVDRGFGNKVTWERPFEYFFKKFAAEANGAVFDNGRENSAFNHDIAEFDETEYDLVYLDPPFICNDGNGTDYYDLYGFLEGLARYTDWKDYLDYKGRMIRFKHNRDCWVDRNTIYGAFDTIFNKFQNSIIVVSYRIPGTPSEYLLRKLLAKHKKKVTLHRVERQYALSSNANSKEILLIGE